MLPWLLAGIGLVWVLKHFHMRTMTGGGVGRSEFPEPTRSYIADILSRPSKRFVLLRLGTEGGVAYVDSFESYQGAATYAASHRLVPNWIIVDRETW